MRWNPNIEMRNTYLKELKQYIIENGDSKVPYSYTTASGIRLGYWVLSCKQSYRHGTLSEEVYKNLNSLGVDLGEKTADRWEREFQMVLAYYDEHGTINVDNHAVTNEGFEIGAWIARHRYYYKMDRLDDSKIKKLEEIGIAWTRPTPWDINYLRAKKYFDEYGNLDVKSSYLTDGGFHLRHWISDQRRNKRILTQEQIDKLDALKISWMTNSEWLWETSYNAVESYCLSGGDINSIPPNYRSASCKNLSGWISNQKKQYREKDLDERKIERLEKLGIKWAPPESSWERAYSIAEAYYKEYGYISVSRNYVTEDGFKLGLWIKIQKNQAEKLSKEQRDKLELLNIDWRSDSEKSWDRNYSIAKDYYENGGNLNLITNKKNDERIRKMATWIHGQRKKIKKGKLSPEKIDCLVSIGLKI